MAAAKHDIVIEEGSTFDLYITEYMDHCTPRNLNGYGAKFQVRKLPRADSTILYEGSLDDGHIAIQPSGQTGMIHVHLPIEVVNNPAEEWDIAYWDLLIWDGSGNVNNGAKRLVEGKARWSPAVTRPV